MRGRCKMGSALSKIRTFFTGRNRDQESDLYANYDKIDTVIDEINILEATKRAIKKAVGALAPVPSQLLIDAVSLPDCQIPQLPIIHGDAVSVSISAASIVAKVTRDRMMEQYDIRWPEYGFARNKGYGTAEHIAALKAYGPCPIHRRSFIGKYIS